MDEQVEAALMEAGAKIEAMQREARELRKDAGAGQVDRQVRCWRDTRVAECYVDHDGRILGEVTMAIGGAYNADAPLGKRLGVYIDRESAKSAVERAAAGVLTYSSLGDTAAKVSSGHAMASLQAQLDALRFQRGNVWPGI